MATKYQASLCKVPADAKIDGMLVYDLDQKTGVVHNGEPTSKQLIEGGEITPLQTMYVRSHGVTPESAYWPVDRADREYSITVGGLVKKPLTLSLASIKKDFPRVETPCTLECAGNRRADLLKVQEIPGETPWEAQAIGNMDFAGACLGDILTAAGVQDGAKHVEFIGGDICKKGDKKFYYAVSVPIEAASKVIIAYDANGRPLTPQHGFPLRTVVPGYLGARSVKWLTEIIVRRDESECHFQQTAYKLFPPYVPHTKLDWKLDSFHAGGITLGELPVTSNICTLTEDEALPVGSIVTAKGYAIAGGTRTVARVDFSADGGKTWGPASIISSTIKPGVWVLWEAKFKVQPGIQDICVRAVDSACNMQPESIYSVVNAKGYYNNAIQHIKVRGAEGMTGSDAPEVRSDGRG